MKAMDVHIAQADVLLVQPPYEGAYNFWKSESLGMGYLAAALESRGYTVSILDAFLMDLDCDAAVRKILESPPRLMLGFSLLSYELYRSAHHIIDQLRSKGFSAHVTAGSWFTTFWHQTMLVDGFSADSVVCGEGEQCLCELADYLHNDSWGGGASGLSVQRIGQVLVLRQKTPVADLDSLPHPRRDYLPAALQKYYLATMHTARGCGHNRCTFCSVPSFYKGGPQHRLRSPDNVIEEVAEVAGHGAKFLFFCDEDFLGQSAEGQIRALRIFEGVAGRGIPLRYTFNCTIQGVEETLFRRLAGLGLTAVYIGVESNLNRLLKLFGKGSRFSDINRALNILNDLGVKIVPGWIMFERTTTLDEVQQQIDFLTGLNAYHVNYLKSLYVMKDTAIERIYGDELYRTYYDTKYYFQDPDVDLLVRILMRDYLPEALPYTNGLYPIWHKLLGGYGSAVQQRTYDVLNAKMRELSLGFTAEAMARIRKRSLKGLAGTLREHMQEWRNVGIEIDSLARALK